MSCFHDRVLSCHQPLVYNQEETLLLSRSLAQKPPWQIDHSPLYTHSEIAGKKQRESRNFFWQSLRHCCVAHKTKAWAEKESLQKLNMNYLVGLPFKACTFLGTTVNLLYLWNIRIAKKNVMPFSRVSTCEKLGFVFSLKLFCSL